MLTQADVANWVRDVFLERGGVLQKGEYYHLRDEQCRAWDRSDPDITVMGAENMVVVAITHLIRDGFVTEDSRHYIWPIQEALAIEDMQNDLLDIQQRLKERTCP